MPVCPWCIWRATHGDEESATRQAEQASACISTGPAKGHGHVIVAHALKWCRELCRTDAQHPEPPTSQSVEWGSLWMQAGWMQTQAGGRTSVAQWMHHVHPASTASSSSRTPPVPAPGVAPPGLAGGSAVLSPMPHPKGQAPPPPPPLPAPENITFQVWGGNKNGWVSYQEPVQHQLRELFANGGSLTEVTIAGCVYAIHLTAVDDMDQDRRGTGFPPRKVRILEHDQS